MFTMKTEIILVSLILGEIYVSGASYNGYQVYSVSPTSANQLDALKALEIELNLDFWEELVRVEFDRTYRVMVEPKNLLKFENAMKQNSITHSILVDDVDGMIKQEKTRNLQAKNLRRKVDGVDFSYFWQFDEILEYMTRIADQYADFVTIESLGDTYEGNPIMAVKISKAGGIDDTRPVIIIEGTIHAREWIGTMVCMHLITELVENSEAHDDILDGIDWIIVPVMNVDGYKFTYAEDGDRFWRKNRAPIPASVPNPEGCIGVDLNRNFGYKWERKIRTSTDPCGLTWPGDEAESEVETQIIRDLFLKYKNTVLFLDVHSTGNYLLYPWAYDYILADTFLEYEELGVRAREAIYSVNNTRYKMGNTAFTLYSCSGVTTDYTAGVAKIPLSWVIELPGGGTRGFDIEPHRIQGVVDETFPSIRELALFVQERYV